jgi:acetyl-CoA C-acetyltransferase
LISRTAGGDSGAQAFAEAQVKASDIQHASIYYSVTITVQIQLEDLGLCAPGQGGRFVADGNLISGVGKLPVNADGGGLCNNHRANRGGMTKMIEAVRQLRSEAHPAMQVANCHLTLAHGAGATLATRHGSATMIMERESKASLQGAAPRVVASDTGPHYLLPRIRDSRPANGW